MCGDVKMVDLEECDQQVKTANGTITSISTKGSISIDGIQLNNVLCGKNWNNIISVGNLVYDHKYSVIFE